MPCKRKVFAFFAICETWLEMVESDLGALNNFSVIADRPSRD